MTLTKINSQGIKDNEISNADISNSAAIAGNKITPNFSSNISITNTNPQITLVDSNNDSDFKIDVNSGVFSIKDHTNVNAIRLSINSSGNVGIGTSSPSSLLHVRPLDETNFLVRNEGSTVVLASETNSGRDDNRGFDFEATHFTFIEGGTEKVRIDSSGNVGIGTASPSGKFDVVDGTTSISFKKTSNTPRIDFKGNNVSDLCQIKAAESSGGGVLQFFTKTTGGTATERVRVDTSGNVGIGVTTVQDRLHIANNGNANIQIESTATGSGANAGINVKSNDGGDYIIQTGNAVSGGLRVYDATANAVRVVLNSSGKFGIGGDPLEPLDVLLSGTSRRILFRYHGSINNIQSANNNSNNEHLALCGDTLRFHTGSSGTGTEAMRIDSSGRVMIGVTGVNHASANADDFCVGNNDSSSEHGITIGSNVAGTIRWADSGSGGAGIIEYVHSADQMKFYTAGTLAATIKSNQRVLMPAVYSAAGSSMRDVQIESDGNLCGLSSITAAKTNITDLTDVSWIYNLKPKSFNFRKKTVDPVTGVNTYLDEAEDEKAHGFLAEDVESINKDFCFYDKDSEGKDVLAGVYYKTMVVPLINAVQDLKAENTSLAKRVAALEAA